MSDSKSTNEEVIKLPCLNCGNDVEVLADGNEARGVFNTFCNGDCEDEYAANQ